MQKYYVPPRPDIWKGRNDGDSRDRYFKIIELKDLTEKKLNILPGSVSLLGYSSDIGVKRNLGSLGAAKGPGCIKEKLASLAVHVKTATSVYDVGDVTSLSDDMESAQLALADLTEMLTSKGSLTVVLGGGHELAWGQYLGLSRVHSIDSFGVINIDAHFDLRPLENGLGSSGTPFNQIAIDRSYKGLSFNYFCLGIQKHQNTQSLFARAEELKTKYFFADQLHKDLSTSQTSLREFISANEVLYVNICLDVIAASYAPGVSAASPFGMFPWQVISFLDIIASSKKVIGYAIAEFAPELDPTGISCHTAAGLLSKIIENV